MSITIEQLVNNEIHYGVSHMVHTINGGYGCVNEVGLGAACEQAYDLFVGPKDYEHAAYAAGWGGYYLDDGSLVTWNNDLDIEAHERNDWQDLCEAHDIEPYEADVLEHWIVSDWLADKLIAKGETVDTDFMGLVVWGRTTSGQAITQDYVIQQIYQELVK